MNNMLEKFTMEKQPSSVFRAFFYAKEKNQKQETLCLELSVNNRGNHDKSKFPEKWLSVQTYVTDSEGGCREAYNPILEPYEHGYKLKDDMILEATKENVNKLLETIYNLFMSATGKSATEIKMEKIQKFAKERGIEIYTTIPEGWEENPSTCYPAGCRRIVNGKRIWKHENGKLQKNPEYREAVLV